MLHRLTLICLLLATVTGALAEEFQWPTDTVTIYIRGRAIDCVWREGLPFARTDQAGRYFGIEANQGMYFNLAEAVASNPKAEVKQRSDGSLEVAIKSSATTASGNGTTAPSSDIPSRGPAAAAVGDLGRDYAQLKQSYEFVSQTKDSAIFRKGSGREYWRVTVDWDERKRSKRVLYEWRSPNPYFQPSDVEKYKNLYGGGFRELPNNSTRDAYYVSEQQGVAMIVHNEGDSTYIRLSELVVLRLTDFEEGQRLGKYPNIK